MPDHKYTKDDVGKLVVATSAIDERGFMGKPFWRHARKGDYGRITSVDRCGHPSVSFDGSETPTVVFDEEIEFTDERRKVEDDMINTFFGHQGICGCDGATDDGCPICTPEKKQGFLEEFRDLLKKYR
jgi:hypothetical protein